MTKEELTKIRENLPTRYLEELARRTKKSKGTCSKVLNGYFHSDVVIDEAIKFAQETKEKKESIRKGFEKL
jgi:hypothetical protein